jgi:hypothetical protein
LSTVTLGHLGCGTPIYQNFFKKKRWTPPKIHDNI